MNFSAGRSDPDRLRLLLAESLPAACRTNLMSRQKLRDAIAVEAARLLLRGTENDYAAARRRAARWLSRRKLGNDDLPSDGEIRQQLYALGRWFGDAQQADALFAVRASAMEVMSRIEEFSPRLSGCAVEGPVLGGSDIRLEVALPPDDGEPVGEQVQVIVDRLAAADFTSARRVSEADSDPSGEPEASATATSEWRIPFHHRFPGVLLVTVAQPDADDTQADASALQLSDLRRLLDETGSMPDEVPEGFPEEPDDESWHPDTFAVLRMLMQRLSQVSLRRDVHPEGDALYHSLQVYELGLAERPYDEEFLLACLLHDVGMGLDRRAPVKAALEALRELVTDRVCYLIENLGTMAEAQRAGRIPRSLRRSEHYDDLALLARLEMQGRRTGVEVSELDEALDYIAGLETAWDDV